MVKNLIISAFIQIKSNYLTVVMRSAHLRNGKDWKSLFKKKSVSVDLNRRNLFKNEH